MKPYVVLLLVIGFLVLVGGTLLLIGVIRGDEADLGQQPEQSSSRVVGVVLPRG